MKTTLSFALLLLAATLLGQPSAIKHVIIIGVDGMSPDGILHAHAPNIDSLIAQGSSSFECKAQMPTVSSPNWASIINGAPPKAHGIWDNDWQVKQIKDSVYCHGKKGHIFPTIFRELREQRPHSKIFCFSAWWGFVRLVEPRVCTAKQRTLFTGLTAQRAVTSIRVRKPDLLFIHINEVDETGHKYGHGTPAYYQAVGDADKAIGRVLKAIKKAHIENSTVVMIIADHGGINKGHGGSTPQEVNVPFIIMGPGIKKGYRIKGAILNYDTTATIAKLMSLKTPDCWEGVAIEEIFSEKR